MKILIQVFLAVLIALKVLLGSIFIHQLGIDPLSLEGNAIAAENQKDPEGITKPARHLPAMALAQARQAGGSHAGEAGGEEESIANEEKIDLNFLLKKRAELKEQEEAIAKKRAELLAIQEEINRKIELLTRLRNEIRAEMAKKETIEEQKIRHLIKAYSAMKPQKAASLIEKLDIAFAIELLSKMKGDVAGNILSFVDIEKAARISEGLAKRQ